MLKYRLLIDQEKCDLCNSKSAPLCTKICPHNAIFPDVNSNYVWLECKDPNQCRKCIDACPQQAIEIKIIPKAKIIKKEIIYFESPGIQNTEYVIDKISERVAKEDIKAVVIASCSGSSALLLAKKLTENSIKIVNISAPKAALKRYGWQPISESMKKRLADQGVICREKNCIDEKELSSFPASSMFYDWLTDKEIEIIHLEKVFNETLIQVGGMGMKTAVECVLSACLYGDVKEGELVVGTAGSGLGLDTATVIKATTPDKCFGKSPSERLEIHEILAMPIKKQRWG